MSSTDMARTPPRGEQIACGRRRAAGRCRTRPPRPLRHNHICALVAAGSEAADVGHGVRKIAAAPTPESRRKAITFSPSRRRHTRSRRRRRSRSRADERLRSDAVGERRPRRARLRSASAQARRTRARRPAQGHAAPGALDREQWRHHPDPAIANRHGDPEDDERARSHRVAATAAGERAQAEAAQRRRERIMKRRPQNAAKRDRRADCGGAEDIAAAPARKPPSGISRNESCSTLAMLPRRSRARAAGRRWCSWSCRSTRPRRRSRGTVSAIQRLPVTAARSRRRSRRC